MDSNGIEYCIWWAHMQLNMWQCPQLKVTICPGFSRSPLFLGPVLDFTVSWIWSLLTLHWKILYLSQYYILNVKTFDCNDSFQSLSKANDFAVITVLKIAGSAHLWPIVAQQRQRIRRRPGRTNHFCCRVDPTTESRGPDPIAGFKGAYLWLNRNSSLTKNNVIFFSVAHAVIMFSQKPTDIVITTAHYLKHPAARNLVSWFSARGEGCPGFAFEITPAVH